MKTEMILLEGSAETQLGIQEQTNGLIKQNCGLPIPSESKI